MITLRAANDRGHIHIDWLNSWHTFSFGHYYDEAFMGFSELRVINDDVVAPGGGFATHPHRDMEIITYILDGELEHKDSLGTGSVIRPGDVQRMTAGTGIRHSEFNPSPVNPVHLLQIWILPEAENLPPGYEQKYFPLEERTGKFRLVASRDGREGSVQFNQDASMYAAVLNGTDAALELQKGRNAWVHVARGEVACNGLGMQAGDGAAVTGETRLSFTHSKNAEILVFDLP